MIFGFFMFGEDTMKTEKRNVLRACILTMLLAAAMLFTLAACGTTPNEADNNKNNEQNDHQAETPDLVGCDEDIALELLIPRDRDAAEIVGDRRRVPIFAGSLAAPHAALRPYDLGLARVCHVHDPQIIAVVGVKVPLAAEIDDAGPRVPR